MSYVNAKTTVILNPEFFRKEALAYNANPTDRKTWLNKQLINLKASLNNYASQMQQIMEEGATLDGKSNTGTWLQAIGGVAVVIPTLVTQIAGAVIGVAGMIVSGAERKKDNKALQQLSARARTIQLEVTQIQGYYDTYNAELQKMNLMPIALFGFAAYIYLKK